MGTLSKESTSFGWRFFPEVSIIRNTQLWRGMRIASNQIRSLLKDLILSISIDRYPSFNVSERDKQAGCSWAASWRNERSTCWHNVVITVHFICYYEEFFQSFCSRPRCCHRRGWRKVKENGRRCRKNEKSCCRHKDALLLSTLSEYWDCARHFGCMRRYYMYLIYSFFWMLFVLNSGDWSRPLFNHQ